MASLDARDDIEAPICQNQCVKKGKETSIPLDGDGSQMPHEDSGVAKLATKGGVQVRRADPLKSLQPYVELYVDGKIVRMCRADPACPSRNTWMEKRQHMVDHVRKKHGLRVEIPHRVRGRVTGAPLNPIPMSTQRDRLQVTKLFEDMDYNLSPISEDKETREEDGTSDDDGGDDEEVDDDQGSDEKGQEVHEEEGDEDGSDEQTHGSGNDGDSSRSDRGDNGGGDDGKDSRDDGDSADGSDEGDATGAIGKDASTDGNGEGEVGEKVSMDEDSTSHLSGEGGTTGAATVLLLLRSI
ncbi:hypothetical protein L7F22_058456 [Adiantum nelumboides]|nr:hypothetical protein [Adiantum nelumboides]